MYTHNTSANKGGITEQPASSPRGCLAVEVDNVPEASSRLECEECKGVSHTEVSLTPQQSPHCVCFIQEEKSGIINTVKCKFVFFQKVLPPFYTELQILLDMSWKLHVFHLITC